VRFETEIVGVTEPRLPGIETAEQLIAYCARVSNPANQKNHDTAEGLLKYCAREQHWSIFEMVSMTIGIKMTRDIGRQILRHRSFSFQEFSQRYAAVDPETMFTNRECRLQDQKNRQSSNETEDRDLVLWFTEAQNYIQRITGEYYERSLELGIAKEQARCFLPEGMTMSHMYMAGTLRSWIHYCNLRTGNGTQKEHALVADSIQALILSEFPTLELVFANQLVEPAYRDAWLEQFS